MLCSSHAIRHHETFSGCGHVSGCSFSISMQTVVPRSSEPIVQVDSSALTGAYSASCAMGSPPALRPTTSLVAVMATLSSFLLTPSGSRTLRLDVRQLDLPLLHTGLEELHELAHAEHRLQFQHVRVQRFEDFLRQGDE